MRICDRCGIGSDHEGADIASVSVSGVMQRTAPGATMTSGLLGPGDLCCGCRGQLRNMLLAFADDVRDGRVASKYSMRLGHPDGESPAEEPAPARDAESPAEGPDSGTTPLPPGVHVYEIPCVFQVLAMTTVRAENYGQARVAARHAPLPRRGGWKYLEDSFEINDDATAYVTIAGTRSALPAWPCEHADDG